MGRELVNVEDWGLFEVLGYWGILYIVIILYPIFLQNINRKNKEKNINV